MDPKKTHPNPPAAYVLFSLELPPLPHIVRYILDYHFPRKFQWRSEYFRNTYWRTSSITSISQFGQNFTRMRLIYNSNAYALFCRASPDSFELSGKTELLIFALTFLNSTWYIKNPFLKSKINDVCASIFFFLSVPYLMSWLTVGFLPRYFSWVSGVMVVNVMAFLGTCLIVILWHLNTWCRLWCTFISVRVLFVDYRFFLYMNSPTRIF